MDRYEAQRLALEDDNAPLVLELMLRLWRGQHPNEPDPQLGPSPTQPPAS